MNRKWTLILVVIFLNYSFCKENSAKEVQSPVNKAGNLQKPSKRALLVGINKYRYVRPLFGCVNDVTAMKKLLTGKFEFPQDQIVTLTEAQAHRKAILDAFKELVRLTNTGDVVVVHFSGHGSLISNKSESDRVDETIIPYDYQDRPNGVLPITDNQISGFLSELSKKTNNVTIILDCCHSGGGTKAIGELNERMIPGDSREAPATDEFLSAERGEGSKDSELKSDLSKYVLVAGCRADQKSYEMKIKPDMHHGALTYHLVNILQNANEATTWPEVIEAIRTQVSKTYNSQTPQLEGLNKNSYVFGDVFIVKTPYVLVQPSQSNVTIDGGNMFGQTVGSVFKIFPPGTIDFTSGSIAEAKLTEVSGFSSKATITSGKVTAANSRAIEIKHVYGKGNLFVAFKGNWDGSSAEVKQKIVSMGGISEEKLFPNLTFYKKGNVLEIYAGYDTLNILQSFNLKDREALNTIQTAANHWAKWFHLVNIKNPKPKLSLDVYVNKGDTRGKSIDLTRADFIYEDNSIINFTVKNNSSVPVFVYIIDFQDNGDIDPYPLSALVDRQTNSNEPIPAKDSVIFQMRAEVGEGKTKTRDVMKVFAVTRDANFDFFKQKFSSSQRDVEDGVAKSLKPVNDAFGNTDNWNCIEKVIVAYRK